MKQKPLCRYRLKPTFTESKFTANFEFEQNHCEWRGKEAEY